VLVTTLHRNIRDTICLTMHGLEILFLGVNINVTPMSSVINCFLLSHYLYTDDTQI